MSLNKFEKLIEALIFSSDKGISGEEIFRVLSATEEKGFSIESIEQAIENIRLLYNEMNLAIELVFFNSGYQFLTRKEYFTVINQLHIQRSKKKLSQAALETLAIIAYKQPITKLEIEQIRGVNCDYTIQKLLDKELIMIQGKSTAVGRPILYGMSSLFMDYFGINSSSQLPLLKDILNENNEIGSPEI
ncbi:SMC-Scp complex subunit ScpB [Daejeonella oryzae]|uniref:SMC-Scp complex subunit ScpB n=1 Tax=Daejeonella oryzae TaxID=1122943 RepID=UPI0004171B90|nr:SMC-Scp complex subunit ScpB [Daejeonella oryzae]